LLRTKQIEASMPERVSRTCCAVLSILRIIVVVAGWSFAPHDGLADEAGPANETRISRRPATAEIQEIIVREFERRDPSYLEKRDASARRLAPLTEKLVALQEQGKDMSCSEQIMIETRWLLEQTTSWNRLAASMDRLQQSMETTDQAFARKQSASDGAWGTCYDEWFFKLDATATALNDLADSGGIPDHPLSFLGRIRNTENLQRYLTGLLISDVVGTGIDQRDELGAVTGALSQMMFKDRLRRFVDPPAEGFAVDDSFIAAYRRFVEISQDHSTGYWGAWYRVGDRLYRSADLSITFHSISYLQGKVSNWPQIIDTTLAIKSFEYPYGWMKNGSYAHHNNYDVVKIFRYAWPNMTAEQRERTRAELAAMLAWCLQTPKDPKAPFAVDPTFYSSPGDYYYYGVSFFDEIGYWDAGRRFWTDQNFPEALELCTLVKGRLRESKLDSAPARSAMEKLERNCP
jgi:hypothetical protein